MPPSRIDIVGCLDLVPGQLYLKATPCRAVTRMAVGCMALHWGTLQTAGRGVSGDVVLAQAPPQVHDPGWCVHYLQS